MSERVVGGDWTPKRGKAPAPIGQPKYAINSIYKDISPSALQELNEYLSSQNPLTLPIDRLRGFPGLTALMTEVAASQGTSSASYTNLATIGPELTQLRSGIWLVGWGALVDTTAGAAGTYGFIGVSINGAAPTMETKEGSSGASGIQTSTARMKVVTLTQGSNTLRLQYKGTGQVSFQDRWLFALRTGN